eukprot:g34039.t1
MGQKYLPYWHPQLKDMEHTQPGTAAATALIVGMLYFGIVPLLQNFPVILIPTPAEALKHQRGKQYHRQNQSKPGKFIVVEIHRSNPKIGPNVSEVQRETSQGPRKVELGK